MHRLITTSLLLLSVTACASTGSPADFSGQARAERARNTAEASLIWNITSQNWNAYRVTALLDGSTPFPIGTVDGFGRLKRTQNVPWTTMRVLSLRLTNTVTGVEYLTEPYHVGPGQKVVITIQPSLSLTTVFPLNFSEADLRSLR